MTRLTIGWIGPGLMGSGMAKNLIAAGHDVSIFARRNQEAVEALAAQGGRKAASLEEVASAPIIGMCVTDAPAVEAIVDAILPHVREGALVVDATTSFPTTSVAVADRLAERGARFADAPVTGGPKQAEDGECGSLVGCAEADFSQVEQVVGCYSSAVRRFGGIGAGHSAKLLNNFVSQGIQSLLAECFDRAGLMDVDRQALYEVMLRGGARSAILERSSPAILEGRYDASRFALTNAYKDVRYYCDLAEAEGGGVSPLADAVREILKVACEAGYEERFVSAMHDPEVAQVIRRTWGTR